MYMYILKCQQHIPYMYILVHTETNTYSLHVQTDIYMYSVHTRTETDT